MRGGSAPGRRAFALRAASAVAGTAALAAGIAAAVAPPAVADSGPGRARAETAVKVRAQVMDTGTAVKVRPRATDTGTGPYTGAGGGATAKPLRRAHRTRTAMSVGLTPARPYRNGKLQVRGLVTQLTARGWVPFGHARVVLAYRPRGSSQWYWVLKGYTDAAGRYTFATRAYGDGTWAAYLEPDASHLYSETRQVYVRVR